MDIEARHWRYLLFGDRSELDSYDLDTQRLTLNLEELQQSFSASEAQQTRLEMLKTLVERRQELFQQTAIAYQQQQRSLLAIDQDLIVQTNENQTQIRQTIADLQNEAEKHFQQQVERSQTGSQTRMIIAIKYSAPPTPIFFSLTCEPHAVIFEIRDEGIGIAEEEQSRIFEPFRRGQNVGSTPGSGLGMAVVKKCLDLHRGDLKLHSQVRKGTTFTIKIPQPQRNGLFHGA